MPHWFSIEANRAKRNRGGRRERGEEREGRVEREIEEKRMVKKNIFGAMGWK